MTEPRQSQIRWWVLIGVLGLLRSGTLFAYDTDTKLETALREVQTASATEQTKTKKLTQKVGDLSKALEQAQARGKALEDNYRASEQAKGELAAKATKLETARRESQTTSATGQAKTKKLTRQTAEMLELVSRLRADVVVLHDAIGVSYTMLGMKEEALRAFHRALELDPNHAESHFDLARLYSEYLDDGEAAAPHFRRYVQLRPEAKDAERIRGWLVKAEKELKVKQEMRRWGRGFFLRER